MLGVYRADGKENGNHYSGFGVIGSGGSKGGMILRVPIMRTIVC